MDDEAAEQPAVGDSDGNIAQPGKRCLEDDDEDDGGEATYAPGPTKKRKAKRRKVT